MRAITIFKNIEGGWECRCALPHALDDGSIGHRPDGAYHIYSKTWMGVFAYATTHLLYVHQIRI